MVLPFSFQFIANVCYRVLNRKEHDTVNYSPQKNLQIVLSFCILYKGVANIPAHFKQEANYKKMIPLSFHIEKSEIDESKGEIKELKELIASVLCALKAPFESPMVNGVDQLTALVQFFEDDKKVELVSEIFGYGDSNSWDKVSEIVVDYTT